MRCASSIRTEKVWEITEKKKHRYQSTTIHPFAFQSFHEHPSSLRPPNYFFRASNKQGWGLYLLEG